MTQPCHKDTTPNQQCCDSKHKDRREEQSGTQFRRRTPPHFPTHNRHVTTRRGRGSRTMRRGQGQYEGGRDNARVPHPIRTRGNTTHHPRHSTGPLSKRKGDTAHKTGRPATLPPFTHHATHHPLCRPTIHNSPTHHQREGGAHRGYPATRTAQTHTHHPHTTAPGKKQCIT